MTIPTQNDPITVGKVPSERLYRFHRRQWQLYLVFCSVMAIGTIIAVILPGDNSRLIMRPAGGILALMLVMYLVVRGRNAQEFKEELRRIQQDEWVIASLHRAQRLALGTVIFAQVPLMFLMAYLPPEMSGETSAFGMGMMTTALGCGVMAAANLFLTRERTDD